MDLRKPQEQVVEDAEQRIFAEPQLDPNLRRMHDQALVAPQRPRFSPLLIAAVLLFGLVMALVWPQLQPSRAQESETGQTADAPSAYRLFSTERLARNQSAIQAHSARVYAALNAALAADSGATHAAVVIMAGTDCKPRKPVMASFRFGWPPAPPNAAICTIAANGQDFVVTVVGDSSSQGFVSINGQ